MNGTRGKKAIYIAAAAAVLCVLALAAVLFLVKPFKYSAAGRLMDAGSYEEAKSVYLDLDYKDSAALARECDYKRAVAMLDGGDYAAARPLFLSLGDYDGAEELVRECDYLAAGEALAQDRLGDAIAAFSAIAGYKDSDALADGAREIIYQRGARAALSCDFEAARELFAGLGSYGDSELRVKYCEKRIAAQADAGRKKYIVPENRTEVFEKGCFYNCGIGLIYVPDECTEDTKCLVYFAGGLGEPMLFYDGLLGYFRHFYPDAIMLYMYGSGYNNIESANAKTLEIMEGLAIECGISLHDMCVAGSSSGCYTALHALAYYYENGYIPVKTALMLDAGCEWVQDHQLSGEECVAVGVAGTEIYLFEQPGVGMNKAPIKLMVDSGCDVTVVECLHDDHNTISVNAYIYGLFSWGLGEYPELDGDEYTLKKLYPGMDAGA